MLFVQDQGCCRYLSVIFWISAHFVKQLQELVNEWCFVPKDVADLWESSKAVDLQLNFNILGISLCFITSSSRLRASWNVHQYRGSYTASCHCTVVLLIAALLVIAIDSSEIFSFFSCRSRTVTEEFAFYITFCTHFFQAGIQLAPRGLNASLQVITEGLIVSTVFFYLCCC